MDVKSFSNIARIGQGQFGTVDVIRGTSGRTYAVKIAQKSKLKRAGKAVNVRLEREVHLLATNSYLPKTKTSKDVHPDNPTQDDDHLPPIPLLFASFQSPTTISLVLQYLPCGTLWDLFLSTAPTSAESSNSKDRPRLSETALRWYIPQLVLALQWVHEEANIVHRDIKAQNLLLDEGGRLVISDFGSSALLINTRSKPKQPRHRTRSIPTTWDRPRYISRSDCQIPHGTADYIAPEILRVYEEALLSSSSGEVLDKEEGYDASVDWWSAGAMVFEMSYGVAPFWAEEVGVTYQRIVDSETWLKFPETVDVSSSFKDLMAQWMSPAERRLGRFGPGQVMQHSWFATANWDEVSRGRCPSYIVPPPPLALTSCADSFDASTPSLDWSELNALSDDSTTMDEDSTFLRESNKDRMKAAEVFDTRVGYLQDFTWTIEGFEQMPSSGVAAKYRPDCGNQSFATPSRPSLNHVTTAVTKTILRTATKNPSASRPISDHRALKVMMTCVKESARKRFSLQSSGRRSNVVTALQSSGSESSTGKTFREKLMEAQREYENGTSCSSVALKWSEVTLLSTRNEDPDVSVLCRRYIALCRNLNRLAEKHHVLDVTWQRSDQTFRSQPCIPPEQYRIG